MKEHALLCPGFGDFVHLFYMCNISVITELSQSSSLKFKAKIYSGFLEQDLACPRGSG